MKSSILRALATLSLGAALGPAALMAQSPVYVTIPFDFTIGAKSFAAGEYRVQQITQAVLDIRNVNDYSGVVTLTMPSEASKRRGTASLEFHRYGEDYFLAAVSDGTRAWSLAQSHAERELMAKRASPQPVAVAAALSVK